MISNRHRPWANRAPGSHTPTTGMPPDSWGYSGTGPAYGVGQVGTFPCSRCAPTRSQGPTATQTLRPACWGPAHSQGLAS